MNAALVSIRDLKMIRRKKTYRSQNIEQ